MRPHSATFMALLRLVSFKTGIQLSWVPNRHRVWDFDAIILDHCFPISLGPGCKDTRDHWEGNYGDWSQIGPSSATGGDQAVARLAHVLGTEAALHPRGTRAEGSEIGLVIWNRHKKR